MAGGTLETSNTPAPQRQGNREEDYMGFFLKSGDTYRSTSQSKLDLQQSLPPNVFSVSFDNNRGEFVLDKIAEMPIPAKTYGDADEKTARIVSTFLRRESSTGVLLVGEKGSGKTLLSKLVCRVLQEQHGMPVIVINQPLCGDQFNSFIQSIEQPCAVLFDEFEKVYSRQGEREALLTLLDGVFPSKKLFLLTANNKWAIDTNMRNRPGRIFYMLEFGGLERDFIMDYAIANLADPAEAHGVLKASMLFSKFNFDMMKALIEEMNRYSENAVKALRFLNIKPDWEAGDSQKYSITAEFQFEGKPKKLTKFWSGNPLVSPLEVSIWDPDESDTHEFSFTTADLKRVDAEYGDIVYENEDGLIKIERVGKKESSFNWAMV